MWRVHSCFLRTSKGYPFEIVPKNRKLKDEYGEFVHIAGFWPVLAGVIIG
jgi:hypothetical protein